MIVDLWLDEKFQSSQQLIYIIPGTDPKASLAVEDHEITYGGNQYYIDEIVAKREGSESRLQITANALWMRLAGPKRVGTFTLTAVDAASGLEQILEGTEWVRGTSIETASSGASALQTLDATDSSVLDLVWRWAKLFQLEVVFDSYNKIVDFVETVGVNRGLSFRYGRNLTSVTRTARVPQATRVYPYGRDGLSISSVSSGGTEYVEDFTFYTNQGISLSVAREKFRKDDVWSDADMSSPEALLLMGQNRLAKLSQPWVKYECSVIDLSELTGVNELDMDPGDTVVVYDSVFSWNFETRVMRRKIYPLEPWRNEVELSTLDDNGPSNGGSSGRSSNNNSWSLYKHDATEYRLRNNGTYITNRIALAFSDNGEAVFGYDLTFTGIGTGSLMVSALDATANELVHSTLEIPYVDGDVIHESMTWAMQELAEQYDFRIRMIATASSPGTALGVNIDNDSRFWILARGASRNVPQLANTQRFDYTGALQQFTVPDNVEEVTVEVVGEAGEFGIGSGNPSLSRGDGGSGCRIVFTMSVLPGTVYDVYVGGNTFPAGRGPGGLRDTTAVGNSGGDGGAAASICLAGATFANSIAVAAGGGGGGFFYDADPTVYTGGRAGFYEGGHGAGSKPGQGGNMFGGGAAGTNGFPGTFGAGGNAGNESSSFAGPGGGGGGGWYGGGGSGDALGNGAGLEAGSGGGGASYLDHTIGYDFTFEEGYNAGEGYVIFSWDTPDI